MSGKRGETEIERLPGHPDDACVCLCKILLFVVVVVVVLAVYCRLSIPIWFTVPSFISLCYTIYTTYGHTHTHTNTHTRCCLPLVGDEILR